MGQLLAEHNAGEPNEPEDVTSHDHSWPSALLSQLADILAADGDGHLVKGYGRAQADAERYAKAIRGGFLGFGCDGDSSPARDPFHVVGTGATRRTRFSFDANASVAGMWDLALPAATSVAADRECQALEPPLPDAFGDHGGQAGDEDPFGWGFLLD